MASLDATALLIEWRNGDRTALDRLFPLVYEDLRNRASRALQGERTDHTLTTTALVNETYLKLLDVTRVRVQDRSHFLALAATAMRRVLVDYARRHRAQKRGGGVAPRTLTADGAVVVSADRAEQMLSLDEALERLARINPRHARMVELRFFGGLTVEQTAEALDLAASTVKLDWQKAKDWLYRELAES
jgi:RNA polymerase sigma factor (TIGR02999 family)